MAEVRLQDLLGRRVHGPDGAAVGRIEEVRAEEKDGEFVVTEYHLGPAALLERLAARLGRGHGRAATWDQLDVSDPRKPRLLCPPDELRKLGAPPSRRRLRT
jgi:hypothetical protein